MLCMVCISVIQSLLNLADNQTIPHRSTVHRNMCDRNNANCYLIYRSELVWAFGWSSSWTTHLYRLLGRRNAYCTHLTAYLLPPSGRIGRRQRRSLYELPASQTYMRPSVVDLGNAHTSWSFHGHRVICFKSAIKSTAATNMRSNRTGGKLDRSLSNNISDPSNSSLKFGTLMGCQSRASACSKLNAEAARMHKCT